MSYRAAVRQNSIKRQNLAAGQRRSYRMTLPVPTGGLNTISPINSLEADEAYELVNFVPTAGGLKLREGSAQSMVLLPVQHTRELLTWSYQGTDILIYCYSGGISSSTGVETTGLNGSNWRGTMMNGLLGMVNGVDQPRIFDGSLYPGSFSLMSITGPFDPARFVGIKVFKSRSYFWNTDEFGFWYSAVNALGGTLSFFPLATVAQEGGVVVSINNWTRDGGSGPDDFLVVTTSKGEVIVYQGSNPSDPNDWALVGRYKIGIPVNQRAFLEKDGAIYVLTQTDLEVIPQKFVRQTPPSKISGAIRAAYQAYSDTGQYRLFYDPVRDRIIINIPTSGDTYDQLVRTAFGWTKFTGINASTYTIFNNEVYFQVRLGTFRWGGTKDYGTTDIAFSAKTGYGMLGGNGEKRVVMYRPNMRSSATIELTTALSYDHTGVYLPSQTHEVTGGGTPWGSAWDSAWDQSNADRGDWLVGCGTGQTVSMSVSGSSGAAMEWMANDFEVVSGGGY